MRVDGVLSSSSLLRDRDRHFIDGYLYRDEKLRRARLDRIVVDDVVIFPAQFFGFKIRGNAATLDICLVAIADAPAGVGGQWRVATSGATRVVYLVETSDPNASPLRIKTGTGVKSARLKT